MRLIKYLLGRIAQKGLRVQKTAQRSQVCFVEGLHEALNRLDEAKKAGTCRRYLLSMFLFECTFVYRSLFSSSLLHSFSYILSFSFSHSLSLSLSLPLMLGCLMKPKENREAYTMSQSIEQRLLKIWKYTRYVCLFFASLLYYLLHSIGHVDQSCSYFFVPCVSYSFSFIIIT